MTTTDTANVTGLVAGYGDNEVLGPVDLSLRPGVTALLGRNGSGKRHSCAPCAASSRL